MHTETSAARTKTIAGETWTETEPNVWRGPDADPADHRTDANGYGFDHLTPRYQPDGTLVMMFSPWTTKGTVMRPVVDADGNTVTLPAEARDARVALTRERADLLRARREALHAQNVAREIADAACGVARINVPRFGECLFSRPVETHRRVAIRRGAVTFTRREGMFAILNSAGQDVLRTAARAHLNAPQVDAARQRLARHYDPARRAADAQHARERWAATVATETAEQRDARRAAARERARLYRARKRAEAGGRLAA
ncbi:hypothetical protein [Miltoncostaea marina]|uniref:hypothetical protein n=1 Tax=Miltoncostaea marina TaxID=2843215 RepID=UPI001C3DC63F|nr:hypothetical protein [Miltoncostaea marina]